jgi:hypothetical protein
MLHKTSSLEKRSIQATDGEIGHVKDLLFDDRRWVVRWLVVDAGGWLSSREVLLPSSHLGAVAADAKSIAVDLTRERVKDSPGIDTHLPVSRQQEESIYGHYGWSPYWGGLAGMGGSGGYLVPPAYLMPGVGIPEGLPAAERPKAAERNARLKGDLHLRSASEVRGYRIEATDGDIGHVEDFLVSAEDWAIRYIIVDTRNWWPGKLVLVAPEWGKEIRWEDRTLSVHLARGQIKSAPAFDPDRPLARDDEARLHAHYGLTGYWSNH